MKSEKWKDIQGFEGLYQVSNLGNVRSLDRYVNSAINKSKQRLLKGRVLKPNDNGHGYKYITLSINGIKYREYIHRLVAKHFVDNPNDKEEVNHINGDKTDNESENLEWTTRNENEKHSHELGISGNSLTEISIVESSMIIELIKTGKYTYADITQVFNVPKSLVKKLEFLDQEMLEKYSNQKKLRKNTTGNKILVINKANGQSKVFESAKQASVYFEHHRGYFSELINRSNSENTRYKVELV